MFVFQLDPFLSSEIWLFDGIIAVGLAVFKAKNRFSVFLFLLLQEALKEERRLQTPKSAPHIENIKVNWIFEWFLPILLKFKSGSFKCFIYQSKYVN